MPKKKTTIDDLAVMMKKGFDCMDEQFAKLETGQEDIKLRLDQAAWRFEVQALEKRVKILEKHAGIEPDKIKQR